MRFGCCAGLSSFVKPTVTGSGVQAEDKEDKWRVIPLILKTLEDHGYDFVEFGVGLTVPEDTEEEFGNFILIVDWRLPRKPVIESVPVILPDGSQAVDAKGKDITVHALHAGDSGIYLRGTSKCQINIWNWPVGSGEIWGYRTDQSMPLKVHRAVTPLLNADNETGQWNRFEITAIDDTITVDVNGKTVIRQAKLPELPKRGRIALQHHGDPIQFANIYVKELD